MFVLVCSPVCKATVIGKPKGTKTCDNKTQNNALSILKFLLATLFSVYHFVAAKSSVHSISISSRSKSMLIGA